MLAASIVELFAQATDFAIVGLPLVGEMRLEPLRIHSSTIGNSRHLVGARFGLSLGDFGLLDPRSHTAELTSRLGCGLLSCGLHPLGGAFDGVGSLLGLGYPCVGFGYCFLGRVLGEVAGRQCGVTLGAH
ncbi:hypothetical protein [Nocardia brasiliensis]|uniref:hypothetical protein n=1 Tax=Nocardia brasiliensis TaxID=37326 RepID=UPI00245451FE|nr:hypothetical protein [Nocardia brasiliensis]